MQCVRQSPLARTMDELNAIRELVLHVIEILLLVEFLESAVPKLVKRVLRRFRR